MRSEISASLFRRLAAGVYDIFLIFALLLFATGIALLLNKGHSFGPSNLFFTLYLTTFIGLFYCWFWTHGGQTLGMQAWKIKVVDNNLQHITWQMAIKRFVFAVPSVGLFGVGYIMSFFTQNKLSVHDFASKTRVITKLSSSSTPPID
jgi:uncharacterized RDD family membrane protein YckC